MNCDFQEVQGLRFVTDSMLGKLSRWLRMLGHDVEFAGDVDDRTLLEVSKAQDRVLLTRDAELFRSATKQGSKAVFVKGDSPAERLAIVFRELNLELRFDPDYSRCPACNTKIKSVSKNEILSEIPPSTAIFYGRFWKCQGCGKVYWQGSHWKRIAETLENVKEILKKNAVYSGMSHLSGTS